MSAVDRASKMMDHANYGQREGLELLLNNGRSPKYLRGINISDAKLANHDLSRVDGHGLLLKNANCRNSNWSEALLSHTNFVLSDFSGSDLSGIKARFVLATETILIGANLSQSTFFGSGFKGANFTGANLQGADLSFCDLRNCNFDGADLRGAYLTGSVLTGSTFERAVFDRTDVTGIVLNRSQLSDEQIQNAGVTATGDEDGSWGLILDFSRDNDRNPKGHPICVFKIVWSFDEFGNQGFEEIKGERPQPKHSSILSGNPLGLKSWGGLKAFHRYFVEPEFFNARNRIDEVRQQLSDHKRILENEHKEHGVLRR